MPEEKDVEQPTVEMTRENLETLAAAETLAAIAIAGLKQHGQATFVMRPDGGVAFANPAHVHIHPQAVPDIEDKPFRYVRPILGEGRPSFVVWRDGILWEIEWIEED
jgi:tRNA1(Val) A37 N6-methylase TrmN6